MKFRRHASLDAPIKETGSRFIDRVKSSDHSADRQTMANQLQMQIAHAVEELPEPQREVFLMRHVQGLSFLAISEIVGVSENTVKSRMRYALLRLQQALHEYREYAKELM